MALSFSRSRAPKALLLCTSLLFSACAVAPGITPQEADVRDQMSVDNYMPATRSMRDNIETQELFAQAAFWSNEYDLNPSDLEATIKLAAAVRKLGNPSRAVEITQTSRAIHPRDPYLLAEHAAGLIAQERALDAIPVLDQGLSIAPAYGRLWSLKGAALDQMEEYEAARMNYSRALQITPNDPNVLANLGLSYALAGDLRTSESWLRRAVAIPGAGAGVRQNLALVLQLQGRTEEAEQEVRRSRLTRGDNRLPPEPVPALTPRGTPAQLTNRNSVQGQYQAQTPNQVQGQYQSQYQAQTPMQGGMPGMRLMTTAPDGSNFTSSSEAARSTARRRGRNRGETQQTMNPQSAHTLSGQSQSGQPMGNYNAPLTAEQQAVLQDIQRSRQSGSMPPQGSNQGQSQQSAMQSQPQTHVVGPALRTNPNPTQANPYQAPSSQPPTPQGTTDYSGLAGGASSKNRTPARERR